MLEINLKSGEKLLANHVHIMGDNAIVTSTTGYMSTLHRHDIDSIGDAVVPTNPKLPETSHPVESPQPSLEEEVERLLDRCNGSVKMFTELLALVCREKAEHIHSTYGDADGVASGWHMDADHLDETAPNLHER